MSDVVFTRSGDWWAATLPGRQGAYSQGRTKALAYANRMMPAGMAKRHGQHIKDALKMDPRTFHATRAAIDDLPDEALTPEQSLVTLAPRARV